MARQDASTHRDSRREGEYQRAPRPEAAASDFDRLIHERMRLGIISALAVSDSLSFSDLKKLLKTTDGNLSVHARKLEDAGYIECEKYFEGRVPRTLYRITTHGRKALEQYIDQMEKFIETMRGH